MNIFVGNLSFAATEEDVKKFFEEFGSVASVRIVMEKKGKKSRGFGFVQMPDNEQALAAIAALSGREFMTRPLNVSPACPKPEVERDKGEAKKMRFETETENQQHPGEEKERKDAWFSPVFNKKRGRYKTGRRSRSFMKRRAEAGIAEPEMPKRENRKNPMRWRKKSEQPKPWKKTEGEPKPRRKSETGPKPWKKTEGEPKPWRKSGVGPKPWKKTGGGPKPRRKSTGESDKPWRKSGKRPRPHQSRIQSRRKPGGYTR